MEGQQEARAREERQLIVRQLPRLARRTRLLVRAMTALYLAVALLVLTSIFIGGAALLDGVSGVPPVALALAFAALLLSFETRLSARTTREEMGFLMGLGVLLAALYDNAHADEGETVLRAVPKVKT